ncbi:MULTISPECIES: DUF2267 domain-containing protein [Kitasatospora]|uniref:DUF2267 domain-containing protein n=1 Tax=Kitasatospora cathayae TaxID=3004092 RepID=A0ABY7PW13_9ACTN|nr:DUF2267 domain-containing protein [Kitasatospora sp. HUAS 3-15]WBP84556.1 DUF2267 domain-containing protein [Kitasatospora sp. HUAS 3-15]
MTITTGTGLPNFRPRRPDRETQLIDVAKTTGGSEDRHRAYRLLRAWPHALRDRLPIDVAAHLGAQSPTLVRGVYYEGWGPHPTPVKVDRQEYPDRFGREASPRPRMPRTPSEPSPQR